MAYITTHKSIVHAKRGFPFISSSDVNQVIHMPEIDLGIYLDMAWGINRSVIQGSG